MIKVLDYTKNPLSLMGESASFCWKSTPSPRIGIECIESGHHRVLEFADVTVAISGYSARVIREIYTHIVGVSRLQSSTRYIDYNNFSYIIPKSIEKNEIALKEYVFFMQIVQSTYKTLLEQGIPKEDIANILPLGMESEMVLKINARAILHMAEVRLCTRAYWEYRNFMNEFIKTISEINDEWKTIMSYAKPKCEVYGFCNEKHSCQRINKLNKQENQQ